MPKNKEKNLISIDEVIFRAKRLGVDFGKGNPRERLRYLTKLGLLPHAKRKSFNGKPPNGAYPEYVIEVLKEIDEKIKAGKSIQELKKEKERKGLVEVPYTYVYPPTFELPRPLKGEIPQVEKEVIVSPKLFGRIASVLKIIFLVLIIGGIIFFLNQSAIKDNFYLYLLASFDWVQKLVQAPPAPTEEKPETREAFLPSSPEPYLTINAETDINAPLNVKETITAPALILQKDEFKGTLTSAALTADRTYTFPNLSGTVCLTTGNCVGIGREVFSPAGGTPNRLAKFITSREIGISSINDFYLRGVALTIDTFGNVGIGTDRPKAKLDVAGEFITDGRVGIGIEAPDYPLHVKGRIQATGDICTDLKGGKCLSQLTPSQPPIFIGGGGVGGSGIVNYLPIWTAETTLGNSIISQSGSIINVAGTVRMLSFQLSTGANAGYILTSDASGFGTWQPAPTGTLPVGATGQTLRHDGTNWVANYFLYNTGQAIGIGTTSTPATLTLSGNAIFVTTTLPQLALKYDDNNYFKISVASNGTTLFDSSSGRIQAATSTIFYTANGHPIRKSGEEILRTAVPIFLYDFPAQTASTSFVKISKHFASTSEISLPEAMEGTNRVYRLAIKYTDNIATSSFSDWRIVNQAGTTVYATTTLPGKNRNTFETGFPYITELVNIPDNDWQVEVKIPPGNTIRIFNIFLLAFDKVI